MYSNQQTLGQRQDWGNKNKLCKLFLPAAVSVKRSHSHLVIINIQYSRQSQHRCSNRVNKKQNAQSWLSQLFSSTKAWLAVSLCFQSWSQVRPNTSVSLRWRPSFVMIIIMSHHVQLIRADGLFSHAAFWQLSAPEGGPPPVSLHPFFPPINMLKTAEMMEDSRIIVRHCTVWSHKGVWGLWLDGGPSQSDVANKEEEEQTITDDHEEKICRGGDWCRPAHLEVFCSYPVTHYRVIKVQ